LFAASSGAAQTLSDQLARGGLAATEADLAAIAVPTASDRFALGGVRFLRGVERALQTRYRHGLSDQTVSFPLLRLPIPDNPAPKPFRPERIAEIFAQAAADMAAARAPLAGIADGDAVAVVIDPGDPWLDIDGDGVRQPEEGLIAFLATVAPAPRGTTLQPRGAVRFDTADAASPLAYTHLIAGFAGWVEAWDPTRAIAEVTKADAAFAALARSGKQAGFLPDPEWRQLADLVAIVIRAVNQPADPVALAAARDDFIAMIDANRRFWRRVRAETYNDREWIPNAAQTSVLPLDFPAGTGDAWLAILDDIEAVLRGGLLVPHWRLSPLAGINVARLVDGAPALSLAGVIQGVDLLPYAARGPVVDETALRALRDLVGRNMPLR
jgi:hypothetical protein